MGDRTEIAWADSTFNPFIGCTAVSPACDNCYAREYAKRFGIAEWGPGKPRVRTSAANWKKPLQWNDKPFYECQSCGWRGDASVNRIGGAKCCPRCDDYLRHARRRVFCASLADVFDNAVPVQWRRDLFDLIRSTPNLDWQLLTKRIGIAQRLFDEAHMDPPDGGSGYKWPMNIWLGATICNQEEADRDIPKLLAVPARVRFVSMEPLLGAVDLGDEYLKTKLGYYPFPTLDGEHRTKLIDLLDWVIVGGESGPKARPMHPDWVRDIRDQCATVGVPFILKQWGEWREPMEGEEYDTSMGRAQRVPAFIVSPTGTVHCFENEQTRDGGRAMLRVGKNAAGRLLDGKLHNEFPEVAP